MSIEYSKKIKWYRRKKWKKFVYDGLYFLVRYYDICWQLDFRIDFREIRRRLKD